MKRKAKDCKPVYGKRKGLDGPYTYPFGLVYYFDPVEQKYWDPRTDFYVDDNDVLELQEYTIKRLRGN